MCARMFRCLCQHYSKGGDEYAQKIDFKRLNRFYHFALEKKRCSLGFVVSANWFLMHGSLRLFYFLFCFVQIVIFRDITARLVRSHFKRITIWSHGNMAMRIELWTRAYGTYTRAAWRRWWWRRRLRWWWDVQCIHKYQPKPVPFKRLGWYTYGWHYLGRLTGWLVSASTWPFLFCTSFFFLFRGNKFFRIPFISIDKSWRIFDPYVPQFSYTVRYGSCGFGGRYKSTCICSVYSRYLQTQLVYLPSEWLVVRHATPHRWFAGVGI